MNTSMRMCRTWFLRLHLKLYHCHRHHHTYSVTSTGILPPSFSFSKAFATSTRSQLSIPGSPPHRLSPLRIAFSHQLQLQLQHQFSTRLRNNTKRRSSMSAPNKGDNSISGPTTHLSVPLSQDLEDEISALNCIYQQQNDDADGDASEGQCLTGPLIPASRATAPPTLVLKSPTANNYDNTHHLFLLHPPDLPQPITFKIAIPYDYPGGGNPPEVVSLSVEGRRGGHYSQQARRHGGAQVREREREEEAGWLDLARDVMKSVYEQNGNESVCIYEFVEGIKELLPASSTEEIREVADEDDHDENDVSAFGAPPDRGWVVTEATTEKKSVFIGRACRVNNPEDAKNWVKELVNSDKRLLRATHNMWAYRIVSSSSTPSSVSPAEVIYQDNDDDGETAAGARLAHLLNIMDVRNVLVVVSRWYGGIKLGGDRFRIIGSVGREAVVALLGEQQAQGSQGGKEKEKGGKSGGGGKKARR